MATALLSFGDVAKPGGPAHSDDDAAMVDRLLTKLRRGGSEPAGAAPASLPTPRTAAPRTEWPSATARPLRRMAPGTRRGAIWAWVGLSALLGGALTQWPYESACGWSLVYYLVAIGIVIVAGLWGVILSWNARLAPAHMLALVTVLWGLALVAHEVLPRVGYAHTSATWECARSGRSFSGR